MPLLLTSNGLQGKLKEIFPTLLQKNPQDCTVAFITTAAYGEKGDPTEWLEKYKKQLQEQGTSNIEDVDLRNKTEDELEKILAGKDIVFVNGGNTFFLLYWVRKSGFDKVIKKFLDDDKLYIGVSAGSIICGPTIEVASYDLGGDYGADINTIGLTDVTSLSFVPFLVSPHLTEENRQTMKEQSLDASLPVVALTDFQGILVSGGKIEIVGEGEKVTFSS